MHVFMKVPVSGVESVEQAKSACIDSVKKNGSQGIMAFGFLGLDSTKMYPFCNRLHCINVVKFAETS